MDNGQRVRVRVQQKEYYAWWKRKDCPCEEVVEYQVKLSVQ